MKKLTLPKVFHARCVPLCLLTFAAGVLFVAADVWWLTMVLYLVAAAAIVTAMVLTRRRLWVGVACLVCLALSLSMYAWVDRAASVSVYTGTYDVTGRVAEVRVDEMGMVYGVVLDDLTVDGTTTAGRMQVTLPTEELFPEADTPGTDMYVGTPVTVGRSLSVHGTVSTDYVSWWDSVSVHRLTQGVHYTMHAETCRDTGAAQRRTASERVRCALYRALQRGMSRPSAGVAFAFLTGDTSYVPADLVDGYRSSGMAHMMAVSGLHVGVLAGALVWLLRRLRCPAWGRTVVLTAVLGVYAWLCGGTPSVLRASVLLVTGSVATLLGCHRDKPSMLCFAALVLLLVRPIWLFDVSFLLSFGAYAGIIMLYDPIRGLLGRQPRVLADALALDFAVTLGIAPLGIYFFGGLAVLALPLNLVLIPVMSVMYVVLLLLAPIIAVPALSVLAVPMDYVLRAFNYVVWGVGQVGYLSCHASMWQLPVFYGAVALASPYCLIRPAVRYAAAGGVAAVLLLVLILG